MDTLLDRFRFRGRVGPARRLAVLLLACCVLVTGLAAGHGTQAHAGMHMADIVDTPAHHHHAHHAHDEVEALGAGLLHDPEQCQSERHCAATCAQGSSVLPLGRVGVLAAGSPAGIDAESDAPPPRRAADRLLRPPRHLLTA